MRNSVSNTSGSSAGEKTAKFLVAGFLATAAVIATSGTVSFQDVAGMTGTKTERSERWLAHMVEIPNGSVHVKSEDRIREFSASSVEQVRAVRTSRGVRVVEGVLATGSDGDQRVNRASLGGRVYEAPETFRVAGARDELIGGDLMLDIAKADKKSSRMAKLAQSFRPTTKAVPETIAEAQYARFERARGGTISENHLKQARVAARRMAAIFEKVKRNNAAAESYDLDTVVTAYAPQENDVASAFEAVLRPSNAGGSLIKLGPGDHAWAKRPLPKRTKSAAERRCLAAGVYFEARGEAVEGQKAVAQVILNRVKNPTYPNTICGVVYQNKKWRNRCQFSFACDGIRDQVKSKSHWRTAKKVANDAIDGRFWLKSVGSSSHYHADYVWPKWRRKMKKMVKIGRHIFYRTYGGGWS